jgi:PucR family transcriptional regulator, purine catabolism regulatory protein
MGSTSITLAELCEIPHLGLTALTGASELRRPVLWTHVSELEDPTPFLEGGELLMSVGLHFPRTTAAQVGYVERLARRDIAGFALTEEVCPRLTQATLAFARELPFPILSVAPEVSFVEVVRTVANANEQGSQRRLMTHVRIFDSLQSRVASGCTAAELIERIGRITGYDLYAQALDGRELLDGVPVPPPRIARELPSAIERPLSVAGAHVLPVLLDGASLGCLVAVEQKGARAAGLVAVQHAATIVTLELERAAREARIVHEYRALTLNELLGGELAPSAARRRLEREGFDLTTEVALVALACADGSCADRGDLERFSKMLGRRGVPCLTTTLGDRAFALVPAADLSERLTVANGAMRAGASRPQRAEDGLELARREAIVALQAAIRVGKDLVRFGEDGEYPPFLPVDRASLQRLVEAVLGPLLGYDAEHDTTLVASLRCYLESDRSLGAAAKSLFVHSNTLAYRLRRVEEICGRRLASVETQTDLWLALQAQQLLSTSVE